MKFSKFSWQDALRDTPSCTLASASLERYRLSGTVYPPLTVTPRLTDPCHTFQWAHSRPIFL